MTTIDRKSNDTEERTQQVVDELTTAFKNHNPATSHLLLKNKLSVSNGSAVQDGEVNRAFNADIADVIEKEQSTSHVVDVTNKTNETELRPTAFGQFTVLLK